MGRLKYSGESANNANHFWVMTLTPNFKDVDFWDPMNSKHYTMCDRVEFPDIMRTYMKGEFDNSQSILDMIKKRTAKDKVAGNKIES